MCIMVYESGNPKNTYSLYMPFISSSTGEPKIKAKAFLEYILKCMKILNEKHPSSAPIPPWEK